jgi:hypothetical protein
LEEVVDALKELEAAGGTKAQFTELLKKLGRIAATR